ncbi:MAG: potassium channel family protein [Bacteroidota bacterium]
MGPLISLFIIIFLSIIITKIGARALIKTGLAQDAAIFQARSAFTGVGFTTREAEKITTHPLRRKIIMVLMLIGNIGVVSAIASLMLTFIGDELESFDRLIRLGLIGFFIFLIWSLSKSKWLDKQLVRLIDNALNRFHNLRNIDYVSLLKLQDEYEITVITVKEDDWMANRKLKELRLTKEGINLIAIERKDGTYLGTPDGTTQIQPGDNLTLYGKEDNLKNLEQRKQNPKGEKEHESAKEDHRKNKKEQQKNDESQQ